MKTTSKYALAVAALCIVGYSVTNRAQASPAKAQTQFLQSIDRTAIRDLESDIANVLGKSKKVRKYTVVVAGQSTGSMIQQTAINTVRVSIGYSKLKGKERKRADSLIARATTKIKAHLPALQRIADAAPADLVVGSEDKNDIHLRKSDQKVIHIYPVEQMSMPKHLKAVATQEMSRKPKSDVSIATGGAKEKVDVTVWMSGGSYKFSVNKKELGSKQSARTFIRDLIESGTLPNCTESDEARIAEAVYWGGQPVLPGVTFRFGNGETAIGAYYCRGGINRYLSTIAP